MKKVLVAVLLSLMSSASLSAAAFETKANFKTAEVVISSEKPLVVGNNLWVLDTQKDGKPFTDGKVEIKVFMPEMPGMPAMSDESTATQVSEGRYEVNVNLSMSGTWQVHIFLTPKEGKKIRIKTSLNL